MPAALAAMHYLIDGSNCLGRLPDFRVEDPQSEMDFLTTLNRYAAAHRSHRFTVFFDGYGGTQFTGAALRVRRAAQGQTADDIIVAALERLPQSDLPHTVVVTDDRDLARRSGRVGATTAGTRTFWADVARSVAKRDRRIAQPQPSPGSVEDGGLSPQEVDEWQSYFKGPKPKE